MTEQEFITSTFWTGDSRRSVVGLSLSTLGTAAVADRTSGITMILFSCIVASLQCQIPIFAPLLIVG